MAKRPNPISPIDDAEVVRQMDLLKDVDPSDVTLPNQDNLTPEDREMLQRHEAMMARLDATQGKEQETVEEMLTRVRQRHKEIQEFAATSMPDSQAGLSFSGAVKTGGKIFSGIFEGAGAIGTAFKELGTGLFNAITDKPIGDQPTVFDLPRMTDEERLGSMDLSGVEVPELKDDQQPVQAEQQPTPSEPSELPDTAPLQFPDTRIPKTKFSDPTSNEVVRQQKLINQALEQTPAPQMPSVEQAKPDIAEMAEQAAVESGKQVLMPSDAPELFAQSSFGTDNDQQSRIVELLENLPRRISEELRS